MTQALQLFWAHHQNTGRLTVRDCMSQQGSTGGKAQMVLLYDRSVAENTFKLLQTTNAAGQPTAWIALIHTQYELLVH